MGMQIDAIFGGARPAPVCLRAQGHCSVNDTARRGCCGFADRAEPLSAGGPARRSSPRPGLKEVNRRFAIRRRQRPVAVARGALSRLQIVTGQVALEPVILR